jgi:TRAP-type C4-dicarboxylate transport system permease small subunit
MLVSYLVQIVFFMAVVYGAIVAFPVAAGRISPALGLPYNILYFIMPLSTGLMALYTVIDVMKLFTEGEKDE